MLLCVYILGWSTVESPESSDYWTITGAAGVATSGVPFVIRALAKSKQTAQSCYWQHQILKSKDVGSGVFCKRGYGLVHPKRLIVEYSA